MTGADVTTVEPQQAWVPMVRYVGVEGARNEDVPTDHGHLGPILPILLFMVPQSPDPR